jgi:hypothetical protein
MSTPQFHRPQGQSVFASHTTHDALIFTFFVGVKYRPEFRRERSGRG